MRGFGTGLKLAILQVRPTDALMLFRISGWPIFGFLEARLTHQRRTTVPKCNRNKPIIYRILCQSISSPASIFFSFRWLVFSSH